MSRGAGEADTNVVLALELARKAQAHIFRNGEDAADAPLANMVSAIIARLMDAHGQLGGAP